MRPNSHFLVHNGFVYENNENDTFQLRLGISKADKLHNLKCELLHELGLSGSEDFYIRAGPEPIEEHLLCFMRIFNMEKGNNNFIINEFKFSLSWQNTKLYRPLSQLREQLKLYKFR